MQVADFLELERALARDGSAHATPDEQRAGRINARPRRFLDGRHIGKNPLYLFSRVGKFAENEPDLVHTQLALRLRKQQRQQREAHHLAEKRLGGSYGYLLVRLRVDDAVGLAGHRAAQHVGDAEHARALDARVADGRERVSRFARLRHGDHERRRRDNGIAVS